MKSTANPITLILFYLKYSYTRIQLTTVGTDELDSDEDGNLQCNCRNKSLIGIYSKQQGE